MSESAMPNADRAQTTLEELGQLRRRARDQRRQDPLRAASVGVVSLVGAVTFWLSDRIAAQCYETGEQVQVLFCNPGSGFRLGWVWLLAGMVAVAVPLWLRYQRGTWRPSTGLVVVLVVLAIVALPGVLLLAIVVHPVVFPVAAVGAVGMLAARRRDLAFVAAGVLVGAAVLYVEFRTTSEVLLDHNLGLTLYAVAAAALAALAAVVWRHRDRRQ